MPNGLCSDEEKLQIATTVSITPTQLNEIILEKLTLLQPRFEGLRDDIIHLWQSLTNGVIHWDAILERAKKEC